MSAGGVGTSGVGTSGMSARYAVPAAVLAVLAALALSLHAALSHLPFAQWPSLPFNADVLDTQQIILAYAILPRAAVSILAGAVLGLSGALLQRLLRNPIADPSTLGISAGAQLAIVTATLFFPAILDGYRSLVALAGAFGAAALVFALGWRRSFEPVTMVICGMLAGVTAAAISAAMTLSQGEYLMSLVTWNGGALSQQDWSVASGLLVLLAAGLGLALALLRPLAVLGLGDAGAKSLGVSLFAARLAIGALAVALAGMVAAHVGLVSFVGLAAPALVRAAGVRRSGSIILVAPLAGGLLLWLCDGLVQLVASTTSETFPTGAVTALIGGPLLLWLLPRVRSDDAHQPQVAALPPGTRRDTRRLLLPVALFIPVALLALALGKSAAGWALLHGADFHALLPLRWPRLLAACGAGGLLALAGAILQRLTGNPMASPEIIGVSGGAGIGFAVAISIVPGVGIAGLLTGAGAGALVVMLFVLLFAGRRNLTPNRVLLAGVAVSSLSSAVLSALLAIGDQRSWQILAWLGGSASTATPVSATVLGALAILMLAISLFLARWLTILPLGLAVPRMLGLPLAAARIITILIAGLATGAASLLVGPLSFVGLMAPHMALRAGFMRARDHLMASFVFGSLLMVLADVGARSVTFPYELPLGLFAALAGAPFLISLMARKQG